MCVRINGTVYTETYVRGRCVSLEKLAEHFDEIGEHDRARQNRNIIAGILERLS